MNQRIRHQRKEKKVDCDESEKEEKEEPAIKGGRKALQRKREIKRNIKPDRGHERAPPNPSYTTPQK
jgi:hypothetical protein